MGDVDEESVAMVEAVAGLLACVAYADREYSDAEQSQVRAELRRVHGLSEAGVNAICAVLAEHIQEVATVNPQAYTRALRDLGEPEMRREVLEVLVDLAAADDEVSMAEADLLRRTTAALGLEQADYNAAQERHRERLSLLK